MALNISTGIVAIVTGTVTVIAINKNEKLQVNDDRDIEFVDPGTGNKITYTNIWNGKYRSSLSGEEYTKEEIDEQYDYRDRNKDLFRKDNEITQETIKKQREDNKKLSKISEDIKKTIEDKKYKLSII